MQGKFKKNVAIGAAVHGEGKNGHTIVGELGRLQQENMEKFL